MTGRPVDPGTGRAVLGGRARPRVLNKRHDGIPPGAVYVGRPSKWGNPFPVDRYGRERCIEMYREHLLGSPELMAALGELRGRDLACWCHPLACHADVLVELANAVTS